MKIELRYSLFVLFLLLVVFLTILSSGYTKSFWEGFLLQCHGILIEIFVIILIFESIQRRQHQKQVKKVLDILKPKIIRILDAYKDIFKTELNGNFDQTTFENLLKVDFLKEPNAKPFSGNIADYIKLCIERNESEINSMVYKYSTLLEFSLLRNLETLLGHPLILRLKFLPVVISMNMDGYIKHNKEFRYFSLMPDKEKNRIVKDFEDFNKILEDTKQLISST